MRSGSQAGAAEAATVKRQRVCWLALSALLAAPAGAAEFAAPMTPPTVEAQPVADNGTAPPPLLSPDTPPSPDVPPLVTPPPLGTSAPIPKVGAGNCVRRDERGRFMGWMDYQHCVYSGRTLATARWLDDFFGDWYDDEATMLVRVISESDWVEEEGVGSRVHVRASAVLPNARKRLRLVVSDDNDDEPANQDIRSRLRQNDNRVSAALRWITLEKAGFKSDFDVGVHGVSPPEAFARLRLRKNWGLTRNSIARFSQSLRYGSDSKEHFVSLLDLERAVIDERSVLRFSSLYDYANNHHDDGFLWTHGVSLSRALERSRSLSYGFSVSGHTRPNWRSESYGPWFAYRSSFLRPWLFFEVEPHYGWYRDKNWDGLASVVVTVEMQVGVKQ